MSHTEDDGTCGKNINRNVQVPLRIIATTATGDICIRCPSGKVIGEKIDKMLNCLKKVISNRLGGIYGSVEKEAIVNGQTIDLTRNTQTGKWEATVTAPSKSSYTQEGRCYGVVLKAIGD